MKIKRLFIVLLLLIVWRPFYSQSLTQIKLVKANKLSPGTAIGINGQRLLGEVVFSHNGTIMTCDSAYLYEIENSLDAFGHVYINDNDSIFINADSLHYNGNTRICELHYGVKLRDQKMTLTTSHLTYNLNDKIANYYGGGKIIDKENNLKSDIGYYYVRTKTFFYKKNVILKNPDYTMYSDTLEYNTNNKTSYFYGPTKIISEKNTIYCENGWYNTKNDISQFNKNAYIISEDQQLKGDNLYYDRKKDYGKALNNVSLIDTIQNYIVQGNFGEYFGMSGTTIFADSTLATIIDDENDTLFLHSDTLFVLSNKDKKVDLIKSYYKTKYFKSDLQGLCDSLIYSFKDSLIEMYGSPVVWSQSTQISGSIIKLKTKNDQPEVLYIEESAFIFSLDSNNHFNQVSGKRLEGYFENNDLKNVKVFGNSETIYFVRDDNKELVGVNIALSGDLELDLEKRGIKKIRYFDKPIGSLNPEKSLSERDMLLKGFNNKESNRPKSKMDVYIW